MKGRIDVNHIVRRCISIIMSIMIIFSCLSLDDIHVQAAKLGMPVVRSLEFLETEDGEFYLEATVEGQGAITYTSQIYSEGKLIGEKKFVLKEDPGETLVIDVTDNDLDDFHSFDKHHEYLYVLNVYNGLQSYTTDFCIADRDIPITEEYFPDIALREYVLNFYDINQDKLLSLAERRNAKELIKNVYEDGNPNPIARNYIYIADFTGMEFLTYLERLELYTSEATYFNPGVCPKLKSLSLFGFKAKYIDFSFNKDLEFVGIYGAMDFSVPDNIIRTNGEFEFLDFRPLTKLKGFVIYDQDKLWDIALGDNPDLERIIIINCPRSRTIDLTGTKMLRNVTHYNYYANYTMRLNEGGAATYLYVDEEQYATLNNAYEHDDRYPYDFLYKDFVKYNFPIPYTMGKLDRDDKPCGAYTHNLAKQPKITGSCGKKGISADIEVCSVCGATPSGANGVLPTGVHDLEKIEGYEPTCIFSGLKDYYRCKTCHLLYSDAAGTVRIPELVTWKQSDGKISPTSTHHNMTLIPGKKAICEEDGYKQYYYCDICDCYYEDIAGTKSINDEYDWKLIEGNIPALGHIGGNATCHTKGKCTRCEQEYYDFTQHDQSENIYYYSADEHWSKCKFCGEKMDVAYHNFRHIETVPATCSQPGILFHYICECGLYSTDGTSAGIIEDIEAWKNDESLGKIAPYGSHWESSTYLKNEDSHWKYCERCGEKIESTVASHRFYDNNGNTECMDCNYCSFAQTHAHETWVPNPGKEANCVEDGYKEYYECAICSHYFADGTNLRDLQDEIEDIEAWKTTGDGVIKAKGHTGGNATCDRLAICSECNNEYGQTLKHSYDEELHADKDHHWVQCKYCLDIKDYKPHVPGPEATEFNEQTCAECGYVLAPKLSHTHILAKMEDGLKCSEDGYEIYYLCDCGLRFKDPYALDAILDFNYWKLNDGKISALGHTGGTATCTALAICDRCGNEYGTILPHEYETKWSFNRNSHWKACKNCDDFTELAIHTPGVHATNVTDQVCTVCNAVIAPKLSHKHNLVKINGMAATCQLEGYKSYYSCDCGFIFEDAEGTKIIDDIREWKIGAGKIGKVPHNGTATCISKAICTMCGNSFGELADHNYLWIIDKPATETETGLKHEECTVCGFAKDKVVIDKLPENHVHSFLSSWTKDETNHWKVCECGEKKDVAKHIFDEGIVIKNNSYEDDGDMLYTCTVCKATERRSIGKIKRQDITITLDNTTYTIWLEAKDMDGKALPNADLKKATAINGNKLVFSKPSNMKLTGYTFKGFYNGNKKIKSLKKDKITDGMIITAKFAENTYSVSYKLTKPEKNVKVKGKIPSIKAKYSESITLDNGSTITVDGYKLIGWTSVKNGTEVEFTPGQVVKEMTEKNKGRKVLYSVWQKSE